MQYLRFRVSGRVLKPLPSAFSTALPGIQSNLTMLQARSQRINAGRSNEEPTDTVTWGSTPGYVWLNLDIAVPMPISQTLIDAMPVIQAKVTILRQYAVSTGEFAFRAKKHICGHEDNPGDCSATEQDI